jgi:hypothetical protein
MNSRIPTYHAGAPEGGVFWPEPVTRVGRGDPVGITYQINGARSSELLPRFAASAAMETEKLLGAGLSLCTRRRSCGSQSCQGQRPPAKERVVNGGTCMKASRRT